MVMDRRMFLLVQPLEGQEAEILSSHHDSVSLGACRQQEMR